MARTHANPHALPQRVPCTHQEGATTQPPDPNWNIAPLAVSIDDLQPEGDPAGQKAKRKAVDDAVAAQAKSLANGTPLTKCLDSFAAAEVLGADNLFKCPECKEQVAAQKRIQFWRLPDVLVACVCVSGCVSCFASAPGLTSTSSSSSSSFSCWRTDYCVEALLYPRRVPWQD